MYITSHIKYNSNILENRLIGIFLLFLVNKSKGNEVCKMMKYIFSFFLFLTFQLFCMFALGQYVWTFKYAFGGVGGSIIEQIDPVFWYLISIEILIFLVLMGLKRKNVI